MTPTRGRSEPQCYISGPMTGYPNFNAEAFDEAAVIVRESGWGAFVPTENDAEAGIILAGCDGTETFDFNKALAKDAMQVCLSDAVFVLPGWEKSRGARIEVTLAFGMKVPVYYFETGEPIKRVPPLPGELVLPTGSSERKNIPLATGVLDYFPAALAAVAEVSKVGNDKHNPGEPLHWARGKSMDQADCVARHLIERGGVDPDTGLRHTAQLAWRALALLQIELEEAGEAPLARGASA